MIIKKYLYHHILLCATITAVIAGLTLGLYLRTCGPSQDTIYLINFPGEIFMQLLKLIILPLIISSVISGREFSLSYFIIFISALAQLNPSNSRRIGIFALIYYTVTTTISIIVGHSIKIAFKKLFV